MSAARVFQVVFGPAAAIRTRRRSTDPPTTSSAAPSRVLRPGCEEVIVTPNHPLHGRTHRLFDADGVEIKLCVWADTATGEVAVAVRPDEGRLEWTVGDTGTEVARKK